MTSFICGSTGQVYGEDSFAQNISTLLGLKKNNHIVAKQNKQLEIQKNKIKTCLLNLFQTRTVKSQTVILFSDMCIFFKQDLLTILRKKDLSETYLCKHTKKHIIICDVIHRRKYVSFSWLAEVLCDENLARKYFVASFVRQIQTV